jgi:acetyl esterase
MALHHQTTALLAAQATLGLPAVEDGTPEEARAVRKSLWRPSPEPIADVTDLDAAGVPCRRYRPAAIHSDGLLVWFHGGGWVIGDLDSHDDLCRVIANRAGCTVLSVGYRLAPEHPFPAPLEDCRNALAWAGAHAEELGVAAERIAVGGDSAGGNMAAVVSNDSPVPLCGQVLIYPVIDARMGHPSIVENAEGYFLTAKGMAWFWDHYLQGHDVTDVRVTPLLDSDEHLASGPPAFVVTAEFDPLRDEGVEYAARLAAAGVSTSHVQFAGQIHGFFSMFGLLDDCRSAQASAAEFLRTCFAR